MRAAERRLAAARFADEAERLAGGDVEATRRRRLGRRPCRAPNSPAARRSASSGSRRRRARARHATARRGKKQRTRRRRLDRRRARGASSRQRSCTRRAAIGEAAARRQLIERAAPCPGSPASAPRSSPRRLGNERERGPRCRDGAAARTASRRGACSTTWPAYITTTSSQVSATTPRSCVMSRIAMPSSRLQRAEQLEDLRLDRDVERGGRLVGDEQRRAGRRAPSRSSRAAACRPRAGADSRARAARDRRCRPCRTARPPRRAPPPSTCRGA